MAKRLVSKYIGEDEETYLKILDAKMINARRARVNSFMLSALENTVGTVAVQEARNLLLLQTTLTKRKENVKMLIL
jgi:hypothetical protein